MSDSTLLRWLAGSARPPRLRIDAEVEKGLPWDVLEAELRQLGWEAELRESTAETIQFRAFSRRLFGDGQSLAVAAEAEFRIALNDVVFRSCTVSVLDSRFEGASGWTVAPTRDATSTERQRVRQIGRANFVFADHEEALRRFSVAMGARGLRDECWSLDPVNDKALGDPALEANRRSRRGAFVVLSTSIAIGVAVGMALPNVFGYRLDNSLTPNPGLAVGWIAAVVGLVVAIANIHDDASKRRRRLAAALVLLMLIFAAGLGTAALTYITTPPVYWLVPTVIASAIIATTFQRRFGAIVATRLRLSPIRLPIALVIGAAGVTLIVLGLNLPMAVFYLGTNRPQLIGTTTWGITLLTGFPFVALVTATVVLLWIAVAGWRRKANLLGAWAVPTTLTAILLATLAVRILAGFAAEGSLVVEGDYDPSRLESLYSVCMDDPNDAGSYWLLGTSGRTTVLVDRRPFIARSERREPARADDPKLVDDSQPLRYVEPNADCRDSQ